MTDRTITIPSLYMGQPDAELTLDTPDGERGSMALIVAGRTLASADDFNAPRIGLSLLEQSDAQLAGMFGGFLAHALESTEPDARDGWQVLEDDAGDWTDALALMETDEDTYEDDARGVREVLDVDRYPNPSAVATCGACGRSWDDSIATAWTPAPSARCPFESDHEN